MSSGEESGERNPFAAPPPDAPDQPWRPRGPHASSADGEQPDQPGGDRPQLPPPWADPQRPAPQQPAPPRIDPAEPGHRNARNALLCGFAALLSALFGLFYFAFALGLLAAWYAIAVLRAPAEPPAHPYQSPAVRPQTPAALSGLLTGGLALVMSISAFTIQFVYHDYLDCVSQSITDAGTGSCAKDAPAWLVNLFEGQDG
ncbi:hypothetical protein AB0K51_31875 [Kitasatospora sp. NPDC049285]|uniref:hypothetical protein n=1 Tax=Kitasatospora sp. NPDC049285 TaxID=3157096 RepID=UPI003436FF62